MPTKRSKTINKRKQKTFCKSKTVHGGYYMPAKAAKPVFTQPPTLVTIPQAATTGMNIFAQPPNNTAQASLWTFVFCAHLLVASTQTIIYLLTTQNGWIQKRRKNWIGMKTYERKRNKQRKNRKKDSLRTITLKPPNQIQSPFLTYQTLSKTDTESNQEGNTKRRTEGRRRPFSA